MKKTILLLSICVSWSTWAIAQSVGPSTINAAGGSAPIGSNQFDWSIGEMTMVSTFSMSSIVVTQGVLQPYDAGPSQVPVVQTIPDLNVFPDPATSFVNMRYNSLRQGTLSYRLMDMAGRVVRNATVPIGIGLVNEEVNVASLANGAYLLEVTVVNDGMLRTATYKIEKMQ